MLVGVQSPRLPNVESNTADFGSNSDFRTTISKRGRDAASVASGFWPYGGNGLNDLVDDKAHELRIVGLGHDADHGLRA